MFCPKCGNLLNDNEKYCRSCGAKVERSESKVNAPCDHSHGTTELPPVTLGEAVRLFFTRYVDFEGRSRRSEFWGAQLALWVCSGLVNLVLRGQHAPPASGPWPPSCPRPGRFHSAASRHRQELGLLPVEPASRGGADHPAVLLLQGQRAPRQRLGERAPSIRDDSERKKGTGLCRSLFVSRKPPVSREGNRWKHFLAAVGSSVDAL